MANNTGGVWRTIGGKRIFIKGGQGLSSAMKESGKFGKSKTNKESSKGSSSIKSQQSDIEKATGSKVEEAFESNLYGNGKEDRFVLSDGRMITHTKESFGEKEDRWTVYKNSSDLKGKSYDSYDAMKKDLGESEKVTQQNARVELRGAQRSLEFERDGLARAKRDGRDVKDISDRTRKVHELELDVQEKEYGLNRAYKNAFEEYKKKHPNSKLTLQKFINMSEGK